MKSFLIVFLLFIYSTSFSQPDLSLVFPMDNGKVVYSEVVKVDSTLTADQLFKNAKIWLIDAFKSAKDVIQTESQSDHLLVAKGFNNRSHNQIVNGKIWFTLKLETKDGRYRYSIYDLIYEYSGTLLQTTVHETTPYESWVNLDLHKRNNPKQQEKVNELLIEFSKKVNDDFVSLVESLKANIIKSQDW